MSNHKIKLTRETLDRLDGITDQLVHKTLRFYEEASIVNNPLKAYEVAFENATQWAYQEMERNFEF